MFTSSYELRFYCSVGGSTAYLMNSRISWNVVSGHQLLVRRRHSNRASSCLRVEYFVAPPASQNRRRGSRLIPKHKLKTQQIKIACCLVLFTVLKTSYFFIFAAKYFLSNFCCPWIGFFTTMYVKKSWFQKSRGLAFEAKWSKRISLFWMEGWPFLFQIS